MDDKRLTEIQGLVQGLGEVLPSTCPGFENHAPSRSPLEEAGLTRALNAKFVRRTLAGDLVLELLGAIVDDDVMNQRAHARAARAERERDEARHQVATLQRLIDDVAAANQIAVPQPPEPDGWVFGVDLRRALDGKRAVGNDPLVLEVQQKLFALGASERALAEAQQHVTNLKLDLTQIMDERDRATKAADDLAYAIAPDTVIGEHTNANFPWANALEILKARHWSPIGRPADQADWVCDCGLPMARNPHPDAGKPDVLLNVGATYVCIPCTVRTRHGWANQARERRLELEQLQARHELSIGRLRDTVVNALRLAEEALLDAPAGKAVAGATRNRPLPEICLEGHVTAVSLIGHTIHVRPTRTDALLVFNAASGGRRRGWEGIQARVTLKTRSGEMHMDGAAGWCAQDLIAVTFSGAAAKALHQHASTVGIALGERAKVTWPLVAEACPS